jgi:hypothetical protein
MAGGSIPLFKQAVNLPFIEGTDPVPQRFAPGRKFPALLKGPGKRKAEFLKEYEFLSIKKPPGKRR